MTKNTGNTGHARSPAFLQVAWLCCDPF